MIVVKLINIWLIMLASRKNYTFDLLAHAYSFHRLTLASQSPLIRFREEKIAGFEKRKSS